jgi:DNA-binding XRE family transcriptional regulator
LALLALLPCTIPYMAPRLDPEGDLSRRLREALRTTDESIRSISTATGVTRQTLMAFRDGKRTIYLDAADRIAAHFRLTLRKETR